MRRFVWWLGVLPHTLAGQDANTVLQAAEATYERTATLHAAFVQVIENPMLGNPEESRGQLFLSPPSRFAMRFTDPDGDRIVADGTWLWLYNPSTVPDQVIRQSIPDRGPATPNLFAQFVDDPLARYTASYLDTATVAGVPTHRVRLVPRVEGIPFREAVLAVSMDDGMIRGLEVVEETGQRRRLTFHDIVMNEPIPARELMFRPPAGTRVVSP